MRLAAEAAIAYRLGVPDRPVPPACDLDTAVARFRTPLAEAGIPAAEVIETLVHETDDGLNQMTSPGFYGYVLGGSHPVGVAADMLVSAWGQNAGSSAETPAVTGLERAVCDWVIDLLGLPPESGAGITTGATVGNTAAILAARNALCARAGWDVEARGLFGAPGIAVIMGADAHSAPSAALRYAGFGTERTLLADTDDQGRIRPESFERCLASVDGPVLVVLQAGQINSGASDPFAELIPMARARDAWVHVDGAFGLWLAAVPELAPRLAGVQEADSWAVDLHKWLNAPFDAGMAIVRDRTALVASMSARGAYLPDLTGHWEPTDSVPELSRRARGVPSYAILRHLGRAGVREMVARHCALAKGIAAEISDLPGLSVLNEVASNQVAIRCGEDAEGDAQTREVLRQVQRRGRVYPSHGTWQGRDIIRVSVIGYATQKAHADLLVSEIAEAWQIVRGGN
ncbi:Glutamate or tyrosine decarboxylase [Cribrihabitans marinus]|uniref:Glutamate or tyrosine decarboxylase n=1 Tax=Cribrihabitans marinus TaxID=1227549 RepID=A0A1H6ZED9_9RHOB|nr:aminotransferase class V-fold PLP-dependent enzyme [Cribrihabitans marinus]GGH30858.1 aspartate aminotransferase family protein [Cribrihabitans marinus]SEJ51688.1 Glutamate or tyrosine decarboxylase [Cribrihabitans marinus]